MISQKTYEQLLTLMGNTATGNAMLLELRKQVSVLEHGVEVESLGSKAQDQL